MINFAGHRLDEGCIGSNWPPQQHRIGSAFDALGRLMGSYIPLLDSVKAASDSVAGCPATVFLLKQLFDGLRCGGTISETLRLVEHDQKPAFDFSDRRLQLISIGEECGIVDKTLRMAAHLPACFGSLKSNLAQKSGVEVDDEQAFFLLALGLYFSAGLPPVSIFRNMQHCFAPHSQIGVAIPEIIVLIEDGESVSECILDAQILPNAVANQIASGEDRGELDLTLIRLANLTVWPNFS